VKAMVRRIHSPDVVDLRKYDPDPRDDFSLLVQIIAGPAGLDGEESFGIEVVTPKRLASRVAESGPFCGRHLLVVNAFDYDTIADWIQRVVESCEGENWIAVAEQLARFGHWEFEDYTD